MSWTELTPLPTPDREMEEPEREEAHLDGSVLEHHPLSTKRSRVGRNHYEILEAIERDVSAPLLSRRARELLLFAGQGYKSLGDTLSTQAVDLDSFFTSDPLPVIAAVIEA